MPQMAPILWAVLFTCFYLALAVLMVKLYFFTAKTLTASPHPQDSVLTVNWQW